MRSSLLAVLAALGAAAAMAAGDAPAQPRDPLAGDPVLEKLLQKRQEKEAKQKDPEPATLKPAEAAARQEDEKPLSAEPDAELDRVLDQMEKVRSKFKSLECKLTQRKEVPAFEIDDEYSGALKFRAPRFLRMELRGPAAKGERKPEQRTTITIVNDEYAFLWRVEDKEAERFKLPAIEEKKFSERNPLEYGLAADVRNLKQDYFLNLRGKETVDGREAHVVVAGPMPHLKNAPYKRLYFWVDAQTWMPIRFRQVKSDGEVIETYTLSGIKLDPFWWGDPFDRPPRSVKIIAHDLAEPRK